MFSSCSRVALAAAVAPVSADEVEDGCTLRPRLRPLILSSLVDWLDVGACSGHREWPPLDQSLDQLLQLEQCLLQLGVPSLPESEESGSGGMYP
ncbi:hypothetical protein TYRP_003243 [Tyrophagus putrescentiae]|nr:hypothetical protein TYRP_003243 [Tyrophagus putrescentiae]